MTIKLYQVSFEHIYPGCPPYDDNPKTAFVLTTSIGDAVKQVERHYRNDYESARVIIVSIPNADFISVVKN